MFILPIITNIKHKCLQSVNHNIKDFLCYLSRTDPDCVPMSADVALAMTSSYSLQHS